MPEASQQAVSTISKALLCAMAVTAAPSAAQTSHEFGGHIKTRLIGQVFPDDSIFDDLTGSSALDNENDLRLNYKADRERWTFDAAYQLFALYGDRIEYSRQLPAILAINRLPNDDLRWFQLTDVIKDDGKFASLHRLDRLSVAYTSDSAVLRFGRQAISWGNGLFFSPMDIVNPFDPTAIDTEYKAGDDMLYGQYLLSSGDDVQAAVVIRRNIFTGDVESEQGAAAVKYHGVTDDGEFDLLLARSFDDLIAGFGGNLNVGGAVLRGDLVISDTSAGVKSQLVANFSYSWIWRDKNVSGAVEYFFNGFGQSGGRYSPTDLAMNPELVRRLARGDLFSLGRHYLAGSLLIEMTPLWILTPTLFTNLGDPSAFVQIISQNDLKQNLTFLGSINIPIGANGSEFGGIETVLPDQYLSTDLSVFAQVAWYF